MYCKECGKPLLETDKFCSECGTSVQPSIPPIEPLFQTDIEAVTAPSTGISAAEIRKAAAAEGDMEEVLSKVKLERPGAEMQWDTAAFPDRTRKKTDTINFAWNVTDEEFPNRPAMTKLEETAPEVASEGPVIPDFLTPEGADKSVESAPAAPVEEPKAEAFTQTLEMESAPEVETDAVPGETIEPEPIVEEPPKKPEPPTQASAAEKLRRAAAAVAADSALRRKEAEEAAQAAARVTDIPAAEAPAGKMAMPEDAAMESAPEAPKTGLSDDAFEKSIAGFGIMYDEAPEERKQNAPKLGRQTIASFDLNDERIIRGEAPEPGSEKQTVEMPAKAAEDFSDIKNSAELTPDQLGQILDGVGEPEPVSEPAEESGVLGRLTGRFRSFRSGRRVQRSETDELERAEIEARLAEQLGIDLEQERAERAAREAVANGQEVSADTIMDGQEVAADTTMDGQEVSTDTIEMPSAVITDAAAAVGATAILADDSEPVTEAEPATEELAATEAETVTEEPVATEAETATWKPVATETETAPAEPVATGPAATADDLTVAATGPAATADDLTAAATATEPAVPAPTDIATPEETADILTGEDLEKELFAEIEASEAELTEVEKLRKRQTEKIDQFYTFNKKNEEFQQLLDKEYEKFREENAKVNPEFDFEHFDQGAFYEDLTAGSQAEEMARTRELLFSEYKRYEEAMNAAPSAEHAPEEMAGIAAAAGAATAILSDDEQKATEPPAAEEPAAEAAAEPAAETAEADVPEKGVSTDTMMLGPSGGVTQDTVIMAPVTDEGVTGDTLIMERDALKEEVLAVAAAADAALAEEEVADGPEVANADGSEAAAAGEPEEALAGTENAADKTTEEAADKAAAAKEDTGDNLNIVKEEHFKDSEELANEFEKERAEAWEAFFSDDEEMKTRRVKKAEQEDMLAMEKQAKEDEARAKAAEERSAAAKEKAEGGAAEEAATGASDAVDIQEEDNEEPTKSGKLANFIISLLVVLLVVLLVLVAVRLIMPDSMLSIKMDHVTEWIMNKFMGNVPYLG